MTLTKLQKTKSKHVTLNMKWKYVQLYTVVDVFNDMQ
jgi:hypothetical protein